MKTYLVGGFKHFLFSIIYGIILPIDYFSEGLKPPTRYGGSGAFLSPRGSPKSSIFLRLSMNHPAIGVPPCRNPMKPALKATVEMFNSLTNAILV